MEKVKVFDGKNLVAVLVEEMVAMPCSDPRPDRIQS